MSSITDKYSVDYDLVTLSLPVCASGALFGALSKNFLSDLYITLFSAILMIYLLYTNCKQKKQFQTTELPGYSVHDPLILSNHTKIMQVELNQIDNLKEHQDKKHRERNDQERSPELEKILDDEKNRVPKSKLKVVGFVLLYTLAIFLFKNVSTEQLIVIDPPIDIPDGFNDGIDTNVTNGHEKSDPLDGQEIHTPFSIKITKLWNESDPEEVDPYVNQSGLSSCVVGSFLFIIIHVVLSYLSSKSVAIETTTKDSEKQKYGYVFMREQDKMSSTKMWNCMISGFVGGFVVGLFGIGASVVLIPIWLKSGIDRETAMNSSTPVTFFASLISLLLYMMTGHDALINYSSLLLAIMFSLSFLSTALVSWFINRITITRQPRRVANKIKMALYISSILGLILYGCPAYLVNSFFSQFGFFC